MWNPDTLHDELLPFKEKLGDQFIKVRKNVIDFVINVVRPAQAEYAKQFNQLKQITVQKGLHELQTPQPPILKDLQNEAKKRNLFNFFLPEVCGLTVLQYCPIAEILGAVPLANLAMNCAAPDSGNMEVLLKFGNEDQKDKWLKPLLSGDIRSCFAMTEPGVASTDATNISTRIVEDGNDVVINGHKFYISGAMRPECKLMVLLGRTSEDGPIHQRQTMVLVPMDTPGIKVLRPMMTYGVAHDHCEIILDNVRVPKANIVLGIGRGFEIAQGRLGPGRIHHCMRTVGQAEMALEAMIYRAKNREAFGSILSKKDTIRQAVAEARISITQCRQLCLLAASVADEKGFADKSTRKYISICKVAIPRSCLAIVDEAIQVHGAHGISQDSKLWAMWVGLRTLRLADGADIVHQNVIAEMELSRPTTRAGQSISGVNKNISKYGKFDHLKKASASKL